VHFRFPPAPRSGRVVIETKGVNKSYGDNHVLHDVDFALERGEKVAFLGRNGEVKSTFSRIIAGIESYEGERLVGHNVSIGYFAQHQAEDLDPRRTVLETLDAVATGDIRTRLRTLLGAFLFQGDDVFKRVGVLSGGEKSRLALAKLLLEPVNLLVLDEPTNHLDMASKEVLKQALVAFDGAIVVVSHDRDFLNGIIGKCIEFREGHIKEYLGGIEDYLRRHQTVSINDAFVKKKPAAAAPSGAQGRETAGEAISDKERKRIEAEQRNKRYAATKEFKKKLAKVEAEIAKLEAEKSVLDEAMANPGTYNDAEKMRAAQKRHGEVVRLLAVQYEQWGKIAADIEKAEAAVEGR
jgi:ATP-binding cassette subfamily F protein 3